MNTTTRLLLRVRLNALLRAYIRGEQAIMGQAITRHEIVAELRAIMAVLDAAKAPLPIALSA
jgi:hypothetical protein